ncbi:CoA pyrophosphatase [Flavobacterium sp. I-SCBP12n]|uniref:CoA pyrophosphatase n=2 Tax=Flavobacterium TaxID=237 RepID=A0A9X1XPZ8_9FLAO|nr:MULTISPECIES: CoA pyrophosphatase [Flavobacterium]MBP4141685.1 CoA pyrophosphatase [Flavobacterium flabelliforme]MCK8141274.1 CoA pyrophosphatase [Flavobacterium pygoscelis]
MDFQEFLQFVPKLIDVPLPAFEAHKKMAPLERLKDLKNLDLKTADARIAAVMMLFYPKQGIPHLVLIVRNSYKGVHSAQIAFPGGKYEIDDPDFAFTALRETQEEIGVLPAKIEIVKAFTQLYIPPSNFMVHPFLGISKEELTFIQEPSEVADIIELPLSVFLSESIVVNTNVKTSYSENINIPAFKIENHIVWGATAMMLSELKDVLNGVLKS